MTSVDEIKAKLDIVELVGESVQLQQSGRNFKANCPFHNERTPSFYVFPERQAWHCFGACAAGGDVFSFVMRRDSIPFGEAMRLLAQRAGVELEASQAAKERAGRAGILKRLHRDAAMFFHERLVSSPEAEAAREHLRKRGLDATTIEDYRLGYSPTDVRGLQRYLGNQGYKEEDMVAAGLVRTRTDGSGVYGFFRGRLMIPIQDSQSDYLGFGARALDDAQPKYLNSPQSPVFDKSAILYGLHRAADMMKKERTAVIVEGYMDVLMAHQYGYKNVVAPMGTALTEKHVGTLKRLATTFILALDPDAAGDEATLRSLEGSWHVMDRPPSVPRNARLTGQDTAQDLVLKVMNLPRGQDPDDVIRGEPEKWPDLITGATPVVDYVFRALAGRCDLGDTRAKARVIQRLAPFIYSAATVIEQNRRVRQLAELLKEEENSVKSVLGELRFARHKRGTGRGNPTHVPVALPRQASDTLERYCIAMLLRYPELLPAASRLSPEHFTSTPLQEIFGLLSSGVRPENLKTHLDEHLDVEFRALQDYGLTLAPASYQEREYGLAQNLLLLERRRLKLWSEALQSRMSDGDGAITELVREAEELRGLLERVDKQLQDFSPLQHVQ